MSILSCHDDKEICKIENITKNSVTLHVYRLVINLVLSKKLNRCKKKQKNSKGNRDLLKLASENNNVSFIY